MSFSEEANQDSYPFTLQELPYNKTDLEPYYSKETLDYHHGLHHKAYVDNLNNLLKDNNALHAKSLEEIITISASDNSMSSIFNNAAQVWNHSFFWHSIVKNGGGKPSGILLKKIEEDFGSFAEFAEEFKAAGLTQFGSGWVFLVLEDKKLKIVKTANAAVPIINGQHPIITTDVWEHAYYIDYRNRRAEYLSIFLSNLVNWDFAERNFLSKN